MLSVNSVSFWRHIPDGADEVISEAGRAKLYSAVDMS